MTAPTRRLPFVAQLRSGHDVVRLGAPGEATIALRVQVPEVWDLVRFDVPPTTPVRDLKARALQALWPAAEPAEFVIKLNGFEVLDEGASVAEAGARDGSTFLLTGRRRQPVK